MGVQANHLENACILTLQRSSSQPKRKGEIRVNKKEGHKQDLTNLLCGFLITNKKEEITEYLISNSNLPSPRANLELAKAFAEVVEVYSARDADTLWDLCLRLIQISSEEAPVNDPKEFLPFCGAYAVGAIGAVCPAFFEEALFSLQELANDPRWRIREAVAMGIQKLLAKRSQDTLKALEGWIEKNRWLAMRAVAAGVAEPALLSKQQTARGALKLHEKIFAQILSTKERSSEQFKKLRQGLGYSLSVVVCAIPKEGFKFMRQLCSSRDADILWIIRENLKKNRLIKSFPDDVDSIKQLLK